VRLWARKAPEPRPGQSRLLVPFTGSGLDPAVLDAAIRIARAQESVLVPAYLVVVPREFALEAPLHREAERAMPLLEAVEHAALRAGIPVDARIERGRTPIDALNRLWEAESFDRILVPARAPGHPGFGPKDLGWMLERAPSETLVLRPTPVDGDARPTRRAGAGRRGAGA
jgi:nucleotide-binding universal stress UspA family protein